MDSNFRNRILESAKKHHSRIVFALDIVNEKQLQKRAIDLIEKVTPYISAVKMNFHLLLPLSFDDISKINKFAHNKGLQTIADIKLNDIGSTNEAATSILFDEGFDAIIANPFVGYDGALDSVFTLAKKWNKGVILLTYMSHPAAKDGYGLMLKSKKRVFEEFVARAIAWKADGVVVGATSPEKIVEVRKRLPKKILIFSPGVGAQGGDAKKSINAGSDFLIVGRTIIEADDPKGTAKRICRDSWLPVS